MGRFINNIHPHLNCLISLSPAKIKSLPRINKRWLDDLTLDGKVFPVLVVDRMKMDKGSTTLMEEILETSQERDAEVLLRIGVDRLNMDKKEITSDKLEVGDWPGVELNDKGTRMVKIS